MEPLPTSETRSLDMKSKSILLKLNRDDTFDIFVKSGQLNSDRDKQIGIAAYRLNDASQVVSVIRENDFNASIETHLPFDKVLYIVGGAWNSTNNHFKCKSSGIYKIFIALGVKRNEQVIGKIMLNNIVASRLYSLRTKEQRSTFISRSSLLKLVENDEVHIQVKGSLDESITKTVLHIFKVSS